MNRFEIIGNLGRDPEIRFTPAGTAVATLNIGTTRYFRDAETQERKEQTTWLQVTLYGKPAENAAAYLAKGSKVFVAGRMENDKWEKDGVTHYDMKFVGQEVEYLSPAKGGGAAPQAEEEGEPVSQAKPGRGSGSRAAGTAKDSGK